MNNNACLALLFAGLVMAATAEADYLAPDPGSQISIQVNFNDAIVVRPVGGVWSHPLCPDVTAAVLSRHYFAITSRTHAEGGLGYETVRDLLVQAAMNGRSVNLRVNDAICHGHGYPLIESLRIFP